MKIMIRNSVFRCMLLVGISFLSSTNIKAQQDLLMQIKSTTFYTNTNKLILFNDTSHAIVIIKNNHSCQDCFISINDWVKNNDSLFNVQTYSISISDSTTLERKRNCSSSQLLMPDIRTPLVVYKNTDEQLTSFSKEAESIMTPSIVLVNKGNIRIIPYSALFNFITMNVEENIIREIYSFFKP